MQRREFLKTSALVGTLASLECKLGASVWEMSKGTGFNKSVFSVCEMCSTRCPIEVMIKDEKGVFIQGNARYKQNGTSVCARGGAGIAQFQDKQRIVKPLIRVGER